MNSTLTSRTIAESYDEAIIPFGREIDSLERGLFDFV